MSNNINRSAEYVDDLENKKILSSIELRISNIYYILKLKSNLII